MAKIQESFVNGYAKKSDIKPQTTAGADKNHLDRKAIKKAFLPT